MVKKSICFLFLYAKQVKATGGQAAPNLSQVGLPSLQRAIRASAHPLGKTYAMKDNSQLIFCSINNTKCTDLELE